MRGLAGRDFVENDASVPHWGHGAGELVSRKELDVWKKVRRDSEDVGGEDPLLIFERCEQEWEG